jgi:hypothetical protein
MSPRSRVTPEQAWLYREAERLTEAFCARVREGDDARADLFVKKREEILQRIAEMGAPVGADDGDVDDSDQYCRESAAAIERMIELNRELVSLLQARMNDVRRQLADLSVRRRSLTPYRGPALITPAFVDRVG